MSKTKTANNSNHSKKKATPGPKADRLKLARRLAKCRKEIASEEEARRRMSEVVLGLTR